MGEHSALVAYLLRAFVAGSLPSATAQMTTYTYPGQPLRDTSPFVSPVPCAITGSFASAQSLPPNLQGAGLGTPAPQAAPSLDALLKASIKLISVSGGEMQ